MSKRKFEDAFIENTRLDYELSTHEFEERYLSGIRSLFNDRLQELELAKSNILYQKEKSKKIDSRILENINNTRPLIKELKRLYDEKNELQEELSELKESMEY